MGATEGYAVTKEPDFRLVQPKFDRPPVVETALSVQFRELERFTAVHYGLYYMLIRDGYPTAEERPRLSAMSIDDISSTTAKLGIAFTPNPPPPRMIFVAPDRQELIQVQSDRFAFNWQRRESADYPSYGVNVEKWEREFARFEGFARTEVEEELIPEVVEVVYVNRLTPTDGETATQFFTKALGGQAPASEWPTEAQSVGLQRTFGYEGGSGALQVSAHTTSDPSAEAVMLRLVSRRRCGAEDTVRKALDTAHAHLVTAFVRLTDCDIQRERWGRTQ